MKLPAADWQKRRGLSALLDALGGQNQNEGPRYVGGAVRDTLLGLEVKDIDIATPLLPGDVMERLKTADIKVIPTGIDHGTVTAVLPDGPVEITTLRRDVSTDGRRATVAFSDDWQEDAARRDFTINALFADPDTLEIFDYFDGLDDLKKHRIRFIGSAKDRIAEDHLRIMRYFRFLARFGQHEVDHHTFEACRTAARELSKLSRERIADELLKLLAAADPVYAVQEMIAADVFVHIVDEIDADAVQVLAVLMLREKEHWIAPDQIRRLVALLPKDAEKADTIAKSLRMSKKLQKAVTARLSTNVIPASISVIPAQAGTQSKKDSSSQLDPRLRGDDENAGDAPTPETIRALAYYTTPEAARDRALLFGAEEDIAAMLAKLKDWQPPTFPLSGGDLIAMGMEPGPIVAKKLAQLEQVWVKERFPDDDRVRELAREALPLLP
ncbi:CCA tRNA nucleotidyltransferase [Parasphingorhabdus halotolerans]|uniref:CCA tRNA nucleotidyltransferase n=1 Tax=Parasphingorhabdus halotolerans TaxID=2725558 RepID=A0A6H2DNY0_9SPHN|nr:CCA tRNA nucleotidyltransferase [Parasphingorhabdus halotolerans]QJB69366.1 CCA tRNA nucleotidyltransferase [Parasphingorhabdus halotolerans]